MAFGPAQGSGGGGAAAGATSLQDAFAEGTTRAWGTLMPSSTAAMTTTGLFSATYVDSSSTQLATNDFGPRFVSRSSTSTSAVVSIHSTQDHHRYRHSYSVETMLIPFDAESNAVVGNLGRFMWGIFSLTSTSLVLSDAPAGLNGFGIQFRDSSGDTNLHFVLCDTGSMTRVDSGVAATDDTVLVFQLFVDGAVDDDGTATIKILDSGRTELASHTFSSGFPGINNTLKYSQTFITDGTDTNVKSFSTFYTWWTQGTPS